MKVIRYSTQYKKDIKRYANQQEKLEIDDRTDTIWLERIGSHSELFK